VARGPEHPGEAPGEGLDGGQQVLLGLAHVAAQQQPVVVVVVRELLQRVPVGREAEVQIAQRVELQFGSSSTATGAPSLSKENFPSPSTTSTVTWPPSSSRPKSSSSPSGRFTSFSITRASGRAPLAGS